MKTIKVLISTILLIPTLLTAGSLEDFGNEMSSFYTSPSHQKFNDFQSDANKFEKDLCGNDNGAGLLVSVMIAKISEKHSWPISGTGIILDQAREIAKGQSGLAKYIADDKQIDPGKLDIWWCSYFATGETKYLDKLLLYAGEELPKSDINKMMIIGAATWSFKSNCTQHKTIKQYAISCINDDKYKHKIDYLKECTK